MGESVPEKYQCSNKLSDRHYLKVGYSTINVGAKHWFNDEPKLLIPAPRLTVIALKIVYELLASLNRTLIVDLTFRFQYPSNGMAYPPASGYQPPYPPTPSSYMPQSNFKVQTSLKLLRHWVAGLSDLQRLLRHCDSFIAFFFFSIICPRPSSWR